MPGEKVSYNKNISKTRFCPRTVSGEGFAFRRNHEELFAVDALKPEGFFRLRRRQIFDLPGGTIKDLGKTRFCSRTVSGEGFAFRRNHEELFAVDALKPKGFFRLRRRQIFDLPGGTVKIRLSCVFYRRKN